jgi:hypothetical protein
MWAYIEALKTSLAALNVAKTVKIGLEAALSPADYPVIRLVPSDIKPVQDHYSRRKMTLLIYFGLNDHESKIGLEALSKKLLEMEQLLRDNLNVGEGFKPRYVKTMFDEDRLGEPFKIMCIVIEVEGDS